LNLYFMDALFRNTLGPLAWTAMGIVPLAILALYFLKLKRQPVEVPSTYLWTKVVEDLHVNSIWQRFRRNLLLLLQLMIVLLAIFALLRPGWLGESLKGRQFIFLVDRSASMSAQDVDGGTRLEAAKQRVAALVDQLESDMSAMIIAFDDEPDVVQEFTNNRRLLRDALQRIRPTAKATNIRGALDLASGFANPEKVTIEEGGAEVDVAEQSPVELYIFSDGRFGPVEGFSLGNLQPQYLPLGSPDSDNLAITAFNVRRNDARPELRQAFVQFANFSDQQQTAAVELTLNGEVLDAKEAAAAAGDVAGVAFNLGEAATGRLDARLTPKSAQFVDRLKLDDTAYAVLDQQKNSRVLLITPGNRALELGLSTARAKRLGTVEKVGPESLAKPEFQRQLQSEAYDLVIFDQCAPEKPEQMPQANTLFIGRLPPLPAWREKSSSKPVEGAQIIDWQRAHPLLNLVELGNVIIADGYIARPPLGGKILIDSTQGPLMAIAPRDSFEDAVLGFEIVGRDEAGDTTVNTNWPKMYSFPNFCLNVVQYLAGGANAAQLQNNSPGKPVELDLADRSTQLTVVLPDKSTQSVETPTPGKLVFHDAQQLGVYEVEAAGKTIAGFAVNLFDRQESDVRVRARQDDKDGVRTVDAVSIGYVDVAARSPTSPVRKELWTWILLAALAVLVLEWYIYNRRVYV